MMKTNREILEYTPRGKSKVWIAEPKTKPSAMIPAKLATTRSTTDTH